MAVLTHAQLEQLWILAGGSQATADTAAAIAQAESGGDTTRINNTAYPKLPGYHPPSPGALPEYSVGLWQVNELAHPSYTTATLLSQIGNANAAVAISSGGASFSAWTTYTHNLYEKFLTSGGTPTPQPGPEAPAVGTVQAAHAFSGWADLRNSLNKHLPTQLERSKRTGETTLRLLVHRHKVRH
jgi:Lysozyme like domain